MVRTWFWVLSTIGVLVPCVSQASPVLLQSGYSLTLVAEGANGLDGLTVGGDGFVYVTDYAAGRLYRVEQTAVAGSFELLASGLSNPTDVTRTPGGRLFVTASGTGDIVEVLADGTTSVLASGFPTATSIEFFGDQLVVTNSGPGTITGTDLSTLSTSTILSGISYPYGATMAPDGTLYFIQFGTGHIMRSDISGAAPTSVANGNAFGVQFLAMSPQGSLFATDPLSAALYQVSGNQFTPFAEGFTGKASLPVIGPTGIAFAPSGSMFVADASRLWRIDPLPVAEPSSLSLLALGLITGWRGRTKWRMSRGQKTLDRGHRRETSAVHLRME